MLIVLYKLASYENVFEHIATQSLTAYRCRPACKTSDPPKYDWTTDLSAEYDNHTINNFDTFHSSAMSDSRSALNPPCIQFPVWDNGTESHLDEPTISSDGLSHVSIAQQFSIPTAPTVQRIGKPKSFSVYILLKPCHWSKTLSGQENSYNHVADSILL